jgi:hypothetical protein
MGPYAMVSFSLVLKYVIGVIIYYIIDVDNFFFIISPLFFCSLLQLNTIYTIFQLQPYTVAQIVAVLWIRNI